MKNLIIKIVIILLPVTVLAIAFELIAREITTSYSIKHNNLMKKNDDIEILVLGSSHSNSGINPEYFGRESFNISNTSQGLSEDYKILLKYLPECKNLKLVIIPISYFSLQHKLSAGPEAWRCGYYSIYMNLEGDSSDFLFDLRNYSALFLWDGPLGVIKKLRNGNNVNINEYGYQSFEKTKSDINEIINNKTGQARVKFHDEIMDYNLFEYNIEYLNNIVKELKSRNIKFVFVTTPVYKTYYENISKKNYEIMTNTMDMLSRKYSSKMFNYFYDNRFGISDFRDNDHLNEDGAKKFSIILKNEVIDKTIEK